MGMFDEITINVQIPGIKTQLPCVIQTKDLECAMDVYTIDENGRLILSTWKWENTPKEELPYPDMPFFGSIRKVKDSLENTDMNYHGCIYGCLSDEEGKFRRVEMKFTDGNLVSITAIED